MRRFFATLNAFARFREPRWAVCHCVPGLIALAALLGGCRHEPAERQRAAGGPATVHVVTPAVRTIDCAVEQPGFVAPYEQTSIFAKVSGFIKAFYVDIGQDVKKGDPLVEIFVPELDEQYQQMQAQVEFDVQLVAQAQKLVEVAKSNIQLAIAQVTEAKANVGKYEAEVVRWQSEVGRLARMVQENVVDKQVLTETQRQLDAAKAAKDAALATVLAREADQVTSEANLGKAEIDVKTANAKVKVSQAEMRKAAALLAYTKVAAPYDATVTVRNANTGDYVQAVTGDKSTTSPSAIFVLQRTDIVRVFLDIDERYAGYVQKGTKASVRTDALGGLQIPATVTRTSWALRERSHTLWTEIDLTKQEYGGLRPGMYVYASVFIRRPNVYALPQQALVVLGNQTYCYLLKDGKAVKTPVAAAVSDGTWVEVDRMKVDGAWVKVAGNEQVIVGDLSELTDGQAVEVAAAPTPGAS
jgi:RND family efflux transporter MFP subunit